MEDTKCSDIKYVFFYNEYIITVHSYLNHIDMVIYVFFKNVTIRPNGPIRIIEITRHQEDN